MMLRTQSPALQRAAFGSRARVPRLAVARSAPDGIQVYTVQGKDYQVPLGPVQKLDVPLQTASLGAIFAGLGLGTYATCSYISPAIASFAPGVFDWCLVSGAIVASLLYAASGVLHLLPAGHEDFCAMYPKQGAWGVWYLPGSPSFHVNWTGVAEIAGAAGVIAGAVPSVSEAVPWLQPTAAWGMFLLTIAVTPANVYMFTHNAPGPGPLKDPIPATGHAVRFLMQVFLLATFWGLAHR